MVQSGAKFLQRRFKGQAVTVAQNGDPRQNRSRREIGALGLLHIRQGKAPVEFAADEHPQIVISLVSD